MVMRTSMLWQPGKLTVEERPVPEADAGEVLIKVRACGICGTDVHIFKGEKGAADNPWPIVLGHEFSGTIEKVGKGVEGFRPGDRVSVDPNVLCGHCYYCQNGIGHFCEHMTGIGTTAPGGFAQYCRVPVRVLYPLADAVSFAEGAMAEPLSCCLHGIDLCGIQAGDIVVVIGGGMIGLLMLQLAKLSGAAVTVLVEPVESKRTQARKLGASLCVDPAREDVRQVLNDAGIRRVNTVIECVGKTSTIRQAIDLAGNKSTVMMFGLTGPEESVEIRPYEIFRKEISLKASYINPYTLSRAMTLINNRSVDVRSMAARIIPLEKLEAVLSDSGLRTQGKIIVDPWLSEV